MDTRDQLTFFLDYLKEEGKLTEEAAKENQQALVKEFLARNGAFPREIGA